MLTQHQYETLKNEDWESSIKECCDKETQEDPRGCDCCYDSWQDELKDVNAQYSQAMEKAKQLKDQLAVIEERRDKLKVWYDELTTVNGLLRKICDQLDILLTQTNKISVNTELAVKAIKTLYCMIRDFYMQLDLIKTKYDQLTNCIKCLNDPLLAPGQGFMKCLEDYGKKLEAVIATRNNLISLLMATVQIACRINKNIASGYGLITVITEWKETLKCDTPCDEEPSPCDDEEKHSSSGSSEEEESNCLGECEASPVFLFPLCNDPYYKCLEEQYKKDKTKAEDLAKELLEENKKKESLQACKQSLEAAIKEVDPKLICK